MHMVTAAMKLKDSCSSEENLDSILKSRDITANEDPDNQNYVFSCTDVSWTINKTEYDNSSMVSNFL